MQEIARFLAKGLSSVNQFIADNTTSCLVTFFWDSIGCIPKYSHNPNFGGVLMAWFNNNALEGQQKAENRVSPILINSGPRDSFKVEFYEITLIKLRLFF